MSHPNQKRVRWNPWPVSIIAFFVLAITGCVAFVAFCNLHPADLVSKDYYEQEIRYQTRLDSTQRAIEFGSLAGVNYSPTKKQIAITLPPSVAGTTMNGTVHLYRPSAANLDRSVKLELNPSGTQLIDASGLRPGLWQVKVSWSVNGAEYFIDRKVTI